MAIQFKEEGHVYESIDEDKIPQVSLNLSLIEMDKLLNQLKIKDPNGMV